MTLGPAYGDGGGGGGSVDPLSYATYTLIGNGDPGSGAPPKGPLDNWQRVGDSLLTGITEVTGVGIEQWTLAAGRWKLTASLRFKAATNGNGKFEFYDGTSRLGGDTHLYSTNQSVQFGGSNALVAILDLSDAITVQIRQVSGSSTDLIAPSGSWLTIEGQL